MAESAVMSILHYQIIEQIGEGNMGVVYKARDIKLDRTVAIKFLPRHIVANDEEKERFKIEAKSAAALNNPNIATIHSIEEANGELFIVMEYIDGCELRDLIKSHKAVPSPISESIAYAIQIAEGLRAAHKKGIIHRDIKSSNIMITEDGKIKIMDFGLAKVHGSTLITRKGTTIGTAAYMSPEQARGEEVDHRTDIWAFAVVLYEMLTGQLPFKGDYEAALLYSIVHTSPEPIKKSRPDLPEILQKIVYKGLEKNVAQRYQSFDEVLTDLRSFQSEQETGKPVRIRTNRQRVLKKKHWLIPAVVILVVTLYFLVQFYFSDMSTLTEVPSLAILYLKNLGEENDEPYAYGITQDLIIDLAKSGGIRVAPMQDVMSVQGAGLSIAKIAEKLRVRYIVDGSLKHEQDNYRLSAQVIDASTGQTLWADRLLAHASEVTSLQGRLATAIINTLGVKPTTAFAQNLSRLRTKNPEAYDYYLRAKYIYEKRKTKDETLIARGLYGVAIALDSAFVSAWLALGLSHEHAAEYDLAGHNYTNALAFAKASGDKMGESGALLGLGAILRFRSDYSGALEQFQQSMNLAQQLGDRNGTAWALNSIAIIYWHLGRYREALENYTQSLTIFRELGDRKQESKLLNNIGTVYETVGQYAKALDYYNQRIAISQDLDEPHPVAYGLSNSGNCYLAIGEYSKALDHLERGLKIFRDIGDRMMECDVTGNIGRLYFIVGDTANAWEYLSRCLAQADTLKDQEIISDNCLLLGQLFEDRGENQKALEQYTRGLEIGRKTGYTWGESLALEALGEYCFSSGDYLAAIDSLEKANSIYITAGQKQNMLRTTSLLALCEAYVGNRARAGKFVHQTQALLNEVETNRDYRLVYWRLSQAHGRLQNEKSQSLYLEKAYSKMNEEAKKIVDRPMQKSFLENVKVNREISAAWKESNDR